LTPTANLPLVSLPSSILKGFSEYSKQGGQQTKMSPLKSYSYMSVGGGVLTLPIPHAPPFPSGFALFKFSRTTSPFSSPPQLFFLSAS
jgi:hypothetical protein